MPTLGLLEIPPPALSARRSRALTSQKRILKAASRRSEPVAHTDADAANEAAPVDTAELLAAPTISTDEPLSATALSAPSPTASADSLRAMLQASQRMNAALLLQLDEERGRGQRLSARSVESSDEEAPPAVVAAPQKRASSARASFQALRRLSCSTSNSANSAAGLASTMPAVSRSSSASSASSADDSPVRTLSAGSKRPSKRQGGSSFTRGGSAQAKPSRWKASILPSSKPLRAGALLPSQSAPVLMGENAVDERVAAADAAWPEPLTSPLKPQGTRAAQWGRDAAAVAAAPAAPKGACFSRGLLCRAQEQLSQELTRLQQATHDVLERSLQQPAPPSDEASPSFDEEVISLARRLGWVRHDLSVLQPHVDTNGDEARRAELPRLSELAAAAEEFAASLRAELRTQAHARHEAGYAEQLQQQANLATAAVPRDGNCLFGCVARWTALREAQKASANAETNADVDADADADADTDADAKASRAAADSPSTEAMATAAAATERLERALQRHGLGTASELAEGSAAQRTRVVGRLGEALEARDANGNEARNAVDTLLVEAAHGEASDGTSVRLRKALQPLLDAGVSLGSAEARQAYLEVMGDDGVFGARLELEAISRELDAPVHLYYCLPGQPPPQLDPATRLAPPAEVIAPNGVDAAAEPLRLLHLVSARHFDLLLPFA